MKRRPVSVTDFRGGYATSLPPEIMDPNMLQKAENVYWREGLQKRGGWSVYVDISALSLGYTTPTIKAYHRFRIHNAWRTLAVISDGSAMRILIDNDSAVLTEINASYTMSDGEFYIDSLSDQAVIVNGVDKPAIVRHDGSNFVIQNLEEYDTRERQASDWYAGTYQSSAYQDDTGSAQGAGTLTVSTTTNGDGFYIASVVTFNKFVATSLSGDVSGTATYEYYAGNGTWTSFTPISDTGWNAAEDTTVEWDIFGFSDGEFVWKKFGDVLTQTDPNNADGDVVSGGMIGKFIIRVTFSDTPVSRTIDELSLFHTQYLTQITQGDKPERVKSYRNRIWLSSGSAVNFSQFGSLKQWEEFFVEYFREGGNKILAMETNGKELFVVKAGAIYRLQGDTFESFIIDRASDRGTVSGLSVGIIDRLMPFVDEDGIYLFDGSSPKKVSGHIQSDIDSFTKSNAVGISYMGMYWVSFPSQSIVLAFDPDTIRQDELGELRVSFWKFTNITTYRFDHFKGDGDNGYLVGTDGTDLIRLDNGNFFDESNTSIPVSVKTKEYTWGDPFRKKTYSRMKIDVLQSEDWDVELTADEVTNTREFVMNSFGPENEHHIEDVSMPHQVDGRSLAVQLANDTVHNVKIFGFSVDIAMRRY